MVVAALPGMDRTGEMFVSRTGQVLTPQAATGTHSWRSLCRGCGCMPLRRLVVDDVGKIRVQPGPVGSRPTREQGRRYSACQA